MFAPAIVLVLVLSPQPNEPTTSWFESAARNVLGPNTALRFERLAEPLSDEAALERAGAVAGVVELVWNETRSSVFVHVYISEEGRWVDRTIRFEGHDRDSERGRLLGFAVASMFSDLPGAPGPEEHEAAAERGAPPARPIEPRRSPAVPDSPGPASIEAATAARPRRSISIAGIVASGLGGGTNPELGASAALRVGMGGPLAVRAAFGGRLGEIPAGQANARRLLGALGATLDLTRTPAPIELSVRADLLAGWLQVAHLSTDDVERVHRHRWFAGADAVFSVGYRFSAHAAIDAGVGLEATLGKTHVYTHGAEVANIPIWHGLGEAQVRTDF